MMNIQSSIINIIDSDSDHKYIELQKQIDALKLKNEQLIK